MSKIYDLFVDRAREVLGADLDEKVKNGIEAYLKEHRLFDIEDETDAEFELLMFKQMTPAAFNAFFSHFGLRSEVGSLFDKAKAYALQRALKGTQIGEEVYRPLLDSLLKAAQELSGEDENKIWLKPRLDATLMNLKYAAGLSSEVSEEVARDLCQK